MIGQLALAVHARTPLGLLGDVVQACPTYSAAVGTAVQALLSGGVAGPTALG